ncbi:hypothetical protein MASR1M101_28500 [Gemmatimonas sp.]
MSGSWRFALALLACAAPARLAIVTLGGPVRRAVGGRLTQLGVAAVVWCGGAGMLAASQRGPMAMSLPDALLLIMATMGALLLIHVARMPLAARRLTPPRDAQGAATRLAPGSLSFADGVAALGDRAFYLRAFARHGPVFSMSQFGSPTLCVLGLDRRQAIMRTHGASLGPAPLPFSRSVLRGFLRYMDDATHNHYGPLVRRAMIADTPAHVQRQLQDVLHRHLHAAAQVAARHPGHGAAAAALIEPMVREALDLLLFGFEAANAGEHGSDDHPAERFRRDAHAFYHIRTSKRLGVVEEQMLAQLVAQLDAQETRLMASKRDQDFPLGRLRTLDDAQPDDTSLQNLVFMHRIATNNVSGLISWLLVHWAQHPDIVTRIRSASTGEQHLLLQRFLAETLRVAQSEYTYRAVARTFVHDGIVYPEGWLVRFCVWESHRDPTAFDDPTSFRLRLEPDAYTKSRFAPFGTGRHACNGADLNELLCVSLLFALTRHFDVTAAQVEPLQRAGRHWGHWQPNTRAHFRLQARPDGHNVDAAS